MKQFIVSDPKIMIGKPVVAGTRITVELILEKLSAGESMEQIIKSHPKLTKEGVQSALSFTSKLLKRLSFLPIDKSIRLYSNNKLAQLYRQAVSYDTADPFSHRQDFDKNMEVIKNISINIHEFY